MGALQIVRTQSQLNENEVQIWNLSVKALKDIKIFNLALGLLNSTEQKKYHSYLNTQSKAEFLAARFLVRSVLSRICPDVHPKDWVFQTDFFGKPFIAYPEDKRFLNFNISHSNGEIIMAIGKNLHLGVDIEKINHQKSWQLVAEDQFSISENEELNQLPKHFRSERFFDLWTLKEAFIKGLGLGFSIRLDTFSFKFSGSFNNPRRCMTQVFLAGPHDRDFQQWQIFLVPHSEDYPAAIAVKAPNNEPVTLLNHGEFRF